MMRNTLLLLTIALPTWGADLRAGAARVDITPPRAHLDVGLTQAAVIRRKACGSLFTHGRWRSTPVPADAS
jgi:hypothetical protein